MGSETLDGVTVTSGGKTIPATDFIRGQESIESDRFFVDQTKQPVSKQVKVRYREKPGRKVSKTKIYSKGEIKAMNEYTNQQTAEAKIFKALVDHAADRPVIAADIQRLLPDIPKGTLSGALSTVTRLLEKHDMLKRVNDGRMLLYQVTDKWMIESPAEAFQKYKEVRLEADRKKKNRATGNKMPTARLKVGRVFSQPTPAPIQDEIKSPATRSEKELDVRIRVHFEIIFEGGQ
jgi:hypothetical protein